MKRFSLVTLAAVICIIVSANSGVAAAKSSCHTVVVHATDNNFNARRPASIAVRRCEKIKVEFVFPTQDQQVFLWQVTHAPSKKVLKFVSSGFINGTSDTGTQVFTYRAVGKGRTYVKWGDFSAAYPNAPAAETFKLTVRVR